MKYYVYKISNKINGKWYIGKRRHASPHEDFYMGSGKLIKAAINKYGKENFLKEVIAIFDNNNEAALLEASLVTKESIATDMSYNMHEGGHGGFCHLNDGSKAHIERAKLGGKNNNGKNHENWGKGRFKKGNSFTIEMSKKANENRKKNGLSFEHKEKIRQAALKREQQKRNESLPLKLNLRNNL